MMLKCEQVTDIMNNLQKCENTDRGLLIRTTCVYPSFEIANVLVRAFGDGYIVSDAGEAFQIAISHGQTDSEIDSVCRREALRAGVEFVDRVFNAKVESKEWLHAAIIAVANASTFSAVVAVNKKRGKDHFDATESLLDRLKYQRPKADLIKNYSAKGSSGREYNIDVAAVGNSGRAFFEVVGSHQNSVNSKFTLFSDLGRDEENVNVAVHFDELSNEDSILLQSVATVSNLAGLEGFFEGPGMGRIR